MDLLVGWWGHPQDLEWSGGRYGGVGDSGFGHQGLESMTRSVRILRIRESRLPRVAWLISAMEQIPEDPMATKLISLEQRGDLS